MKEHQVMYQLFLHYLEDFFCFAPHFIFENRLTPCFHNRWTSTLACRGISKNCVKRGVKSEGLYMLKKLDIAPFPLPLLSNTLRFPCIQGAKSNDYGNRVVSLISNKKQGAILKLKLLSLHPRPLSQSSTHKNLFILIESH